MLSKWLNKIIPDSVWNKLNSRREPRYRAPFNIYYQTDILGKQFENEFILVQKDGLVCVKEDAPSDGCTPTYLLFGLIYIGTPDGPTDIDTNLPVTYRAFFLHDTLLLHLNEIGILAEQAHLAFCIEIYKIDDSRFKYKKMYCNVVKRFGPK